MLMKGANAVCKLQVIPLQLSRLRRHQESGVEHFILPRRTWGVLQGVYMSRSSTVPKNERSTIEGPATSMPKYILTLGYVDY